MKNQNLSELIIEIKNKADMILSHISGPEKVSLIYAKDYVPGDKICFTAAEVNKYLVVKVDDLLEEALVYAPDGRLDYVIPFGDETLAYHPEAFRGGIHNISFRIASDDEIYSCKNLAKNTADQRGPVNCYPHATANIETRNEAVFAARNTIDGITENKGHGGFPYQSWGIGERLDAELTVDFGREVEADMIVIYLRADFPHDSYWNLVTFTFSDGSEFNTHLIKTAEAQEVKFDKKVISWVKLRNPVKADDSSPFAALRQIELYGRDRR